MNIIRYLISHLRLSFIHFKTSQMLYITLLNTVCSKSYELAYTPICASAQSAGTAPSVAKDLRTFQTDYMYAWIRRLI